MKISTKFSEQSEPVPMAPLIDIVFLTLVFFMTTAVFSTMESEIDIDLPTADTAEERTLRTHGEIYINLREDGGIVLNNRELTLAELEDVLNRVAEYFPGGSVIIRGDREARHGRTIDILDLCRKADIQQVYFQAVRREAQAEAG